MSGKHIANKYYKINNKIRDSQVRVILNGENLGILSTKEALEIARKEDKDLVLISEQTKPPVAKILDFNKFLYEERKKSAQAKAKSKKSELKELRFGPSIGEADLQNRIQRAKEFIEDGNQVRITVQLRGREKAYPEIGLEKVSKFIQELSDIAKAEKDPEVKNGRISVILVSN